MLPKIGITCISRKNPQGGSAMTGIGDAYIHAVSRNGGIPFLLPIFSQEELLDAYAEQMDGFIFSGGIDISPSFYGENPHPLLTETSLTLDRCQIPLMQKAIRARKPILAICRGHQILNVVCGGTLYQDNTLHKGEVFKHFQSADRSDYCHMVHIEPGSTLHTLFGDQIWTNSFHHQSVKDLGRGLRVTARAEDGIVEAIELEDYPFGLGIQWHPEGMFEEEDSMHPLFEAFIQACTSR